MEPEAWAEQQKQHKLDNILRILELRKELARLLAYGTANRAIVDKEAAATEYSEDAEQSLRELGQEVAGRKDRHLIV